MARVPPMPPRHTEVGMSQVPGVALGPATPGDSQATTPPLLSYFRFLYRRRLRIQKKTYFLGFLPCFLFLLPPGRSSGAGGRGAVSPNPMEKTRTPPVSSLSPWAFPHIYI